MSTTQELISGLKNRAGRIDLYGQLTHNGGTDALEAPWCSDTADDMRAAAARLTELSAELDAVRGKLAGVDEKALTSSPLIEAITPTHAEWRACVTVQDTYDMMKHKLRAAIAAYLTAVRDKG